MVEESFIIEKENNIKVYCYYFIPEDRKNIKGIVQIIHGFGEHAMRYKEFASVLVNNGYAVCTLDNRGHGKTAVKNQNQKMGHIADSNGAKIILEDLHELMEKAKSDFGSNLHYTIFGHSFGSFLARAFAIKYPSEVNALVLSATKSNKNFVDGMGHFVANLQKTLFGSRSISPFMHKMSTGGYAKKHFPEDCNSAAWLTTDKSEQMKFLEDGYCLKTPATSATYVEILNILGAVSKKENINKMRKDLPILLVSGDEDILGDFGKGIEKLYKTYKDLGLTNVTKKIYEGLRHELLNEKSKLSVTNDIVDWIKQNTKNVSPNLERTKNIFKDFVTSTKKDDEQKDLASSIVEDEAKKDDENKLATETSFTDTADSTTKPVEHIDTTSEIVDNKISATDNVQPEKPTEEIAEVSTITETTEESSTAKKTAAKKSTTKKTTAKKTATAKKTTPKKEAAPKKTAAAKKSTSKKETAAKENTTKKTTAKKTAAAKKSTPKKAAPKKTAAAKKSTTKKTTK